MRISVVVVAVSCLLITLSTAFGNEPTWKDTSDDATRLAEKGKWSDALAAAKLSLKKAGQSFGKESLNAAKSHSLLGNLYARRGKFVSAENHYTRAVAIRAKVLGSYHPSLVQQETLLGDLYSANGRNEQAERQYAKALQVFANTAQPYDPSALGALVGIAELQKRGGNQDQSEDMLNNILAVCSTYGKYDRSLHMLAVRSLADLGDIYGKRGQHLLAAGVYGKAFDALESRNNPDALLALTILTRLGDAYQSAGSPARAKAAFKRATAMSSRLRTATTRSESQP